MFVINLDLIRCKVTKLVCIDDSITPNIIKNDFHHFALLKLIKYSYKTNMNELLKLGEVENFRILNNATKRLLIVKREYIFNPVFILASHKLFKI
jgi:hypothetical protein